MKNVINKCAITGLKKEHKKYLEFVAHFSKLNTVSFDTQDDALQWLAV